MSIASAQGELFGYDSFDTIIARQKAEERDERLEALTGEIGALSLDQLVRVQNYVAAIKAPEASDG
jgi:hypothetical protein